MKKQSLIALCLLTFTAPSICAGLTLKREEVVEVDLGKKTKACEALVNRALPFLQKKDLGLVCSAFELDARWREGDVTLFIYDKNGFCYVQGPYLDLIWQDFRDETIADDRSFVSQMLERGRAGGGWVTFDLNHGAMRAYVKTVKKNDQEFILGAGFFPESAEYTTQQLVQAACRYLIKNGAEAAFDSINNKRGIFVRGDIYLWAYNFEGDCLAHGKNIGLVNQNQIDWTDADGEKRNQIIIEKLKRENEMWIDYKDRGNGSPLKRAYVEKVVDPRTKKAYFIGGGYYPQINDETVRSLVQRGINFLKTNGLDEAIRTFGSYGEFFYGPVSIFMYNLEGVMLADADNTDLAGQNLINSRDSEGVYITKSIIAMAKEVGKGWFSFLENRAYKDVYFELANTPDGDFIIGAGYWPLSKPRSVKALVERGVLYLNAMMLPEACAKFSEKKGLFIRGDLGLTVYDETGTVFVDGIKRQRIWQNDALLKDVKGQKVFTQIQAVARAGGGWTEYTAIGGVRYRIYAKEVEKKVAVDTIEDSAEMEAAVQPDKLRPAQDVPVKEKPVMTEAGNIVQDDTASITADKPIKAPESDKKPELVTHRYIVCSGYYI